MEVRTSVLTEILPPVSREAAPQTQNTPGSGQEAPYSLDSVQTWLPDSAMALAAYDLDGFFSSWGLICVSIKWQPGDR